MYKPSREISGHELFADQFAWDGDHCLYRYQGFGPAYRVTDDEMHDLVAAYDRWQRWSGWIGIPILLGLLAIILFVPPPGILHPTDGLSSAMRIASGPLMGMVWNLTSTFLAFRMPLRRLSDRTPVEPALPTATRRRLALERVSDAEIIGLAVFATGGVSFLMLTTGWPREPASLVMTAICAAILLWSIVQGFRKWTLPAAA